MLPAFFTPARLVMAVFFLQAMTLANWVPRIPDVQEELGLTAGELAIALLGMPIGSFLALLSSGQLIERITARRTVFLGFLIYLTLLPLAGMAWDLASLFGALFLLGIFSPLVDVAMNVEAARVQDTLSRPIMSTCHGFWSIGSMAGALIGSAFADAGIATHWHLIARRRRLAADRRRGRHGTPRGQRSRRGRQEDRGSPSRFPLSACSGSSSSPSAR